MSKSCKVIFNILTVNNSSSVNLNLNLTKDELDAVEYFKDRNLTYIDSSGEEVSYNPESGYDIYDIIVDRLLENETSSQEVSNIKQLLKDCTLLNEQISYSNRDSVIPTHNSSKELKRDYDLYFPEFTPPVLVVNSYIRSEKSNLLFIPDRNYPVNFYISKDVNGRLVFVIYEEHLEEFSKMMLMLEKVYNIDSNNPIYNKLSELRAIIKELNTPESRSKKSKQKESLIVGTLQEKLEKLIGIDRINKNGKLILKEGSIIKLSYEINENEEKLRQEEEKENLLQTKINKIEQDNEDNKNIKGFKPRSIKRLESLLKTCRNNQDKYNSKIKKLQQQLSELQNKKNKLQKTIDAFKNEESPNLNEEDLYIDDEIRELIEDRDMLNEELEGLNTNSNVSLIENFLFYNKQYKALLGEDSDNYYLLNTTCRLLLSSDYFNVSNEEYVQKIDLYLLEHRGQINLNDFINLIIQSENEELINLLKEIDLENRSSVERFFRNYFINKQILGQQRWGRVTFTGKYFEVLRKSQTLTFSNPNVESIISDRFSGKSYKGYRIYEKNGKFYYSRGIMNRIPKEEFNDINEILKIIDNSIDTQNIIDFDFSYIQQGNISNGIINVKLPNLVYYRMGDVIEYLDYTPGPYDVYKNNMLIGEFINWVKEQYPERWREILDVINNDPKNMAAFLTYVNPAHPSNVDSAINEIRNNASVKYYYVTKNSTTVGKGKSVIYENGKIKTDRYGKVIYTKDHRTYYSSFVKFNPNDLIISTGKTSRTVAKSPLILLEGIASVFKDNGINVQIVDDDFFKERGIISETGTYPKAYTSRGIVYLNKMRCTTTDAIHEYSHLLLSIPRIKNPKLYEEILMKFKDEYPGINELTQEKILLYGNKSELEILEEIFADKYADYLLDKNKTLNDIFKPLNKPIESSIIFDKLLISELKEHLKNGHYDIFSIFSEQIHNRVLNLGFGYNSESLKPKSEKFIEDNSSVEKDSKLERNCE